jgi:tetratricopeptide (TPR) repeat protein
MGADKFSRCFALATLVWVATITPRTAIAGETLRTEAYLKQVQDGFQQIYQLDYERAMETFTSLEKDYPRNPGPPLDQGVTIMLRELFRRRDLKLDKFITPSYFTRPSEHPLPDGPRETFFEDVQKSERLARAVLEKDPANPDALYFIGSAEAVLASFALTIDHDKGSAFRHGKRAYHYHEELVEGDPEYYDAYVTLGMYEYVVASLPWYLKWLATIIGYHGSETQAFKYLELAAEKGRSVPVEARVLLMVLYVRAKRYPYALEIAKQLHERYRRNFLFHVNVGQILEKIGSEQKSLNVYLEVLHLAEDGVPNYQEIHLPEFRYDVAGRLVKAGRLEPALQQYEEVIDEATRNAPKKALSYLRAGEILDRLGKRQRAVQHYEEVLKLASVDGSHASARRYLKRPYAP